MVHGRAEGAMVGGQLPAGEVFVLLNKVKASLSTTFLNFF